jgi:outer membrane lipoprotein SlyB
MGFEQKIVPFCLLLALGGCATLPTGPSVNVLPAQGKSFDTFRSEDASCRQWAEQRLGAPAQETADQNVATGAVAGTAIGAGLGAALGAASGHAGAGAAIGAASGLLFGTAAGSDSARVYGREAQRRYDNAYIQCMYSYGNQVPGRRVAAAPRPVAVAPPPPPPRPVVVAAAPPPPPTDSRVDLPPYDAAPPGPEMAEPDQLSAPEEVYVSEAPQFLFSPELNMYVAVGVPYDLMYNGADFFYFYGGRWYRGPYYDGPWRPLARRYYPPVFLRYRIGDIRRYRDVEYRRYDHDRGHYNGRLHRPVYRGEKRKAEHRN